MDLFRRRSRPHAETSQDPHLDPARQKPTVTVTGQGGRRVSVAGLMAAACGAVLRNHDRTAIVEIADAAQSLAAKGMPAHLLTRDYLWRTFELTVDVRSDGPASAAPGADRGAPRPVAAVCTGEVLRQLDPAAAARTLERLHRMLAAHTGDDGVRFDARTWLVTALKD